MLEKEKSNKEYTIKGFASKYPFKQEPRINRDIIFEGTKEELEKSSDPLLKDGQIIKEFKFRPSDKFLIIFKEKRHVK